MFDLLREKEVNQEMAPLLGLGGASVWRVSQACVQEGEGEGQQRQGHTSISSFSGVVHLGLKILFHNYYLM